MDKKNKNQGFTLIEIMVVVIILGILTAIVAPNIIGRVGDAQISAAKQDLRNIDSALRLYRLDNFNYPSNEQGIKALTVKPVGQNIRNWKGPYLNKTPLLRMGNENDVANAVIFLSSELSNYITGQNLIVDGGYSVS